MAAAEYRRTMTDDGAIRYDIIPASVKGPYIMRAIALCLCGLMISCNGAGLSHSAPGLSGLIILFGFATILGGIVHAIVKITGRSQSTVLVHPGKGLAVAGVLYPADDLERLEVVAPSGEVIHAAGSTVYFGTGPVGMGVAVAASAVQGLLQVADATGAAITEAVARRNIALVLKLRSTSRTVPVASGLTIDIADRLCSKLAADLGWNVPQR